MNLDLKHFNESAIDGLHQLNFLLPVGYPRLGSSVFSKHVRYPSSGLGAVFLSNLHLE